MKNEPTLVECLGVPLNWGGVNLLNLQAQQTPQHLRSRREGAGVGKPKPLLCHDTTPVMGQPYPLALFSAVILKTRFSHKMVERWRLLRESFVPEQRTNSAM